MNWPHADFRYARYEEYFAESSKWTPSIFTEWITCANISESFHRWCLWPILSLGYKRQPSLRGGGKEGRCVSSPWCSPVFRLTERNCRETCLYKALGKEIIRIISFEKVCFYADGWNVWGQDLLGLGLDSVCHLVSVDLALLANATAVKSWRGILALSEDIFTK